MIESNSGSWCLIESDPGVFNELIRELGVRGIQVEELWSLDDEHFTRQGPIHGLIFLFKMLGTMVESVEKSSNIVDDNRLSKIFFARQVIQNACATQALVSVLLNCNESTLSLGTVLSDFKEFTKSFDPTIRGLSLSNSETIRAVHNSFAGQTVFDFGFKSAKDSDDVFHFVAFVPIDGRVYELDGLKEGPLDLGSIPDGKKWTDVLRPVLLERIAKYNEGEIHFNLLALVSDKKAEYEAKLAEFEKDPNSSKELIAELKTLILEEEEKRRRHKEENILRKHNFLPLIIELLKQLADEKMLIPLFDSAKEKSTKLHEKSINKK